jgi:hypothetical protein
MLLLNAVCMSPLLASSTTFAQQDATPLKSYDSFSALRGDILDFISGATTKVWLHSDYLTDGEIVTSLFMAKYRKLDVKVLLGKRKSNAYMSRLNYLKNQNIPVFLKPDNFKSSAISAVLSDNELVYIDGELDFMSRYKKFNVYRASEQEMQAFTAAFANAANMEIPAIPKEMPLVGRRGGSGPGAYNPGQGSQRGVVTLPSSGSVSSDSGDGAYQYGRGKAPRPDGVPTKLPKETKWRRAPVQEAQKESPSEAQVPELPADN